MIRILITLLLFSYLLGKNNYPFNVKIVGEGKPIILIPGLACSGEVWNETVNSLKENFECHILTLPGFAKQPPIKTNNYLDSIANSIINYINNEISQKPTIIGHSLGGVITMLIATKIPNSLDKIIIVDAYPYLTAVYNPNISEKSAKFQAKAMKNIILNSTPEQFEKQQRVALSSMITDKDKVSIALQWSLQSDRYTIAQAMYEIMTTDLRQEIHKIKVPVLIIASSFGYPKKIVEHNLENQYKNLKNHTILITDKAKHFIMWDEPKWFIASIINFLQQ